MKPGFTIRRGWQPGDIGWVVGEHGRYYDRAWKLGMAFEAKVAEAMGAWLQRYDPAHDLLLVAEDAEGSLGSISLDGSGADVPSDGARVRFFIMADRARGRGIGKVLVAETMAFIRDAGFEKAFLTTFRGLDAARKLYEDHGWALTHEALDTSWGTPLHEQRFDWKR
jgi:GNAT superfamily N-acetyltransferase